MGFKIYTKGGDTGETGLIGGSRVPKNHIKVESYGTVDELNSHIGVLKSQLSNPKHSVFLKAVQDRLFSIGSVLAQSQGTNWVEHGIVESDISEMENEIDSITKDLPELKNFILPGGSLLGAQAHVCRTVCRRAERWVVSLHQIEAQDPLLIKYLNRLSDYFFTLARGLDYEQGAGEIIWTQRG